MINTKRCLAIAAVASSIAVGLLATPASAWTSNRSERYFNTGYQDYPTPGGWGGWHSRPSYNCAPVRSSCS